MHLVKLRIGNLSLNGFIIIIVENSVFIEAFADPNKDRIYNHLQM